MENGLLGVIEAEARREREAILAQARRERERIVAEAREAAERIRSEPPPVGAPPPGDARWAAASARLLDIYHRRLSQLREEAVARLAAKPLTTRRGFAVSFLTAAVAELGQGTYNLTAPPGVGESSHAPRGVTLQVSGGDEDRLELSSVDGTLSISWSLRRMVEQYFEMEAVAVARRLMGGHGGA